MRQYLIIILFSAIAVQTAFNGLVPPKPEPADAPAGKFSAARATEQLKVITDAPHPSGFMANRLVRDYLVSELQNAGLNPQVIPAVADRNNNSYYIENIVAVKRGNGGKQAGKILLSAHYDARGEAPGAGDNGYAVAAVIETLRALGAYPPLKNDLVIIFPDGEELGSLGAKAFVRDNPMADSIDLVLNFDGRGSSGPSLMFESGQKNYQLIKDFSKAHGSSFTNSLSDEVYRMVPNYTDFTWYLKKAKQGLNFAHVGSVENYHAATDDIAHLDMGTFQAHGNSMLACLLYFGNADLMKKSDKEAVYFHLLLPGLIVYPSSAAVPLAVVAIFLYFLLVISGYRKNRFQILPVLASAGVFLLRIIAAGLAVHFTWKMIGPMMTGFGRYELDWIPAGNYVLAGFLAASLVIFFLFSKKMGNRFGAGNVAAGNLLIWLIAAVATSVWFPGASYLFLWPLVFCMIPMFIAIYRTNLNPIRLTVVFMIFAMPGIFLFTQIIYLFYLTMTLRMAGAIAAMFVIVLGLLPAKLDSEIAK